MAIWQTKQNQRATGSEFQITGEAYTVGAETANHVFLNEVPRYNTPTSTVSVLQGATPFTEVAGTPAASQYRVYYDGRLMGAIEFHASDNAKAITVTYFGRGSNVFARDINRLQSEKFDKDGTIAMTAGLRLSAGSAAAPALSFDIDTTLGLYRVSANVLGLAAGGVQVALLSSAGLNVTTGTLLVGGVAVSVSTHSHVLSALTGLLNIVQINATGTADASTYLRGDGTWAIVATGGTGITQAFADSRYLQLTGGTLSGALIVTGNSVTADRYLLGSANMAMRAGAADQAAIVAWNGLQLIGARQATVDIVPATEAGGVAAAGVIIPNQTAAAIALYIRGAVSQAGALTQWANSASTVLATVSATGVITAVDFTVSGVSVSLSTHNHALPTLSGVLNLAQIGASGTRDATTFLRGDGTWAVGTGGGGGLTQGQTDALYLSLNGGTITGNLNVTSALSVAGTAVSLTGHVHSASAITSGVLADVLLSANVSITNIAATHTTSRTLAMAVTTAAALTVRLVADTQPRFQLRTDGQMVWGTGGITATDIILARSAASVLTLTGTLNATTALQVNGVAVSVVGHTHAASDITSGTLADGRLSSNVRLLNVAQTVVVTTTYALSVSTDAALIVRAASDTQPRFQLRADGQMVWGLGATTAPDTTLTRSGVATITLSGSLIIGGSLTAGGTAVSVVGHTHAASDITSGSLADARLSANVMLLATAQTRTTNLTFALAVGTDIAIGTRVSSDTQPRIVLRADGQLQFGAGAASPDVYLSRSGAATLLLTGALAVSTTLLVSSTATFNADVVASATVASVTVNGTTSSSLAIADGTQAASLFLSVGGVVLRTTTNHALTFQTNSVSRWTVDTSGHLMAALDNTYDIGATAATRPRNVYIANSLVAASITLNDGQLVSPLLRDYGEIRTQPSIAANILTLNIANGNVFEVTMGANVTTLTISNVTPSGNACTISALLKQDVTGGRTVTWPLAVKWGTNGAPTLSGANKADLIFLTTLDGGTTWYGSYLLNY